MYRLTYVRSVQIKLDNECTSVGLAHTRPILFLKIGSHTLHYCPPAHWVHSDDIIPEHTVKYVYEGDDVSYVTKPRCQSWITAEQQTHKVSCRYASYNTVPAKSDKVQVL